MKTCPSNRAGTTVLASLGVLAFAPSAWAVDPVFVQQAYLKGSANAANTSFSSAVAFDGDTVVVGAHGAI